MTLVDQVRADPDIAPVSPKMHALLRVAGLYREEGRMSARRMAELIGSAGCGVVSGQPAAQSAQPTAQSA